MGHGVGRTPELQLTAWSCGQATPWAMGHGNTGSACPEMDPYEDSQLLHTKRKLNIEEG